MNWIDRRRQKVRRRRARVALVLAAGVLGGLSLVGACLPAEYLYVTHAVLGRPPETVWRVLTDLDGMPLWRSDLTAVERLPDLAGKPAWREVGKDGIQVVELAEAEAPHRMVIRGAGDAAPGLPIRTFDLVSSGPGTLVTVTERVASRNPLRRVLVRLNLPRPAIERFLRDLTEWLSINRGPVAATPGT